MINTDYSSALVPVFPGSIQGLANVPLCNARDLHAFLQVRRDFSTWIKLRITKYGFVDGQDFVCLEDLSSPNRGSSKARQQITKNFHLTLDMAKELAMVENNERGRQARLHFIVCERLAFAELRQKAESPPPAGPFLMPQGTALLLTFGANGSYRAVPVPRGSMVVTACEITAIVESRGYIIVKPTGEDFKL